MEQQADIFYRELPKVVSVVFTVIILSITRFAFLANLKLCGVFQELHAHLNGSVSFQTIEKLIARKPHLNIEHNMTAIRSGQRRTLDEYVSGLGLIKTIKYAC